MKDIRKKAIDEAKGHLIGLDISRETNVLIPV